MDLPVHIHVGPGRCREIGTVDLDPDDEHQISQALAAALRSAADRLDAMSAVIAHAEDVVRASCQ